MKFTGRATSAQKRWAFLLTFTLASTFFITSSQISLAAEPSRTIFKTISSGEHFSCALTDKGIVYCWGANDRSQLGTSDRLRNSIPNKVYELSNVAEIATGRDFACARILDGGVRCWGRGSLGQTGDGGATNEDRIFATVIPNINSAIGLVAGQSHACALLKDKSVVCWGENQFWQLGNSLSSVERVPIKVTGIPDSVQISSGLNHVCALAESGFSYCWGDNRFGQLGIGNKNVFKNLPSVVLGISKIKTLHLGADTSCAITTTPEIRCWGWTLDGQIPGADMGNQYFPQTTTLGNLVAISPGRTKSCGIYNATKESLLYCWGSAIGVYPITGPASISVSLGYDHGCVITQAGFIQCFGWNHKGQLGTGVTSNTTSAISSVSTLSFPDWQYWIQSWSIAFENDLATITWTGGTPKYKIFVEGLGIVCQDILLATCKFGPLISDKTYTGTITALNSGVTNLLVGYTDFSFTTEKVTSALDKYTTEQVAAAKAKADLEKANVFLTTLAKQIEASDSVASKGIAQLALLDAKTQAETIKLENLSAQILEQSEAIKKIRKLIEETVSKILKKTGN